MTQTPGLCRRAGTRGLAMVVAFASVVAGLTGCDRPPSGREPTGGNPAPLTVVATVGMIADIARELSHGRGDAVRVVGLMGEGVDPHLYKASPGDVRAMSEAGLILYNGLHLEGRMADVIVRMAASRSVVRVTESIPEDQLREPPEFAGHPDPHVWFDVSLWSKAAERIREALIEKDPGAREAYNAAAAEYLGTLAELHQYAKATIATIPEGQRILVTAHDAFGYFGRAYGIEVLAIQGISTDSEASLQQINGLVTTLSERKVPAVFIESSVPRKTIDALIEGCRARGHEVKVGGELFSDAMGREGTIEGTYVGMVLHNVDTIAKALGGRVTDTKTGLLGRYVARSTSTPAGGKAN